jgi:hypothetical protein
VTSIRDPRRCRINPSRPALKTAPWAVTPSRRGSLLRCVSFAATALCDWASSGFSSIHFGKSRSPRAVNRLELALEFARKQTCFGLIDGSVESWHQIIMLQPEILLRRRNPRIADNHPPPAGRWIKETRRSGFFEMKSLNNRRCKENPS